MNGLGKRLRNKSNSTIQQIEKTVKIKVKLRRRTREKANFCSNTVFSLYFKIRAKKIHAAKPLVFLLHDPVSSWPKSLLQFDFKNHENVWTDLKKNIAGRIPETTRRKFPTPMTSWTSIFYNTYHFETVSNGIWTKEKNLTRKKR